MANPQETGLVLMGFSIAAFLGTNSERLPAATFFRVLLLCVVGAVRFMR